MEGDGGFATYSTRRAARENPLLVQRLCWSGFGAKCRLHLYPLNKQRYLSLYYFYIIHNDKVLTFFLSSNKNKSP